MRIARSLTQDQLAMHLDVSKSRISMYENNKREPSFEMLETIADFFNVDMSKLIGDADAPVYSAAAGEGLISDGTPDDEIKLHLEADQTVVKVVGHSMEPTLQDGDLVVFQAQNVIDFPRQICLVQINGNEPTIKRVEIKDDGVLLIGDNINVYTPHFYTAEEVHELPVTIEGVAVKMIRDFD